MSFSEDEFIVGLALHRSDDHAPPVVLLVDDEPALRELMAIAVKRQGYSVLSAASLREAQELLLKSEVPVDVLVLDASLQGDRGDELVLWMLEQHLVKHIVYISGYGEEDCRFAVERSAMRFVQKPFTAAALVNAMRSFLPSTHA